MAKNRLDLVSQEWPENKGFLEGAYKILLLRNVRIKNKNVFYLIKNLILKLKKNQINFLIKYIGC